MPARPAARLPLLIVCVGLLAGVAAAGQRNLKEENKRRDQRLEDPGRYEAMLDAYLAGDTARCVDLLADPEWDATRLRALVHHVDYGGGTNWPVNRWGAAALMHVDVALRLSPDLDSDQALLHVEVASSLVRLGIRERGDAVRNLAARLYVALARLLQDNNAPFSAESILRTARERIPDGASILYASGMLAELLATDYALAGATTFNSASRGQVFQLDHVLARRNGNLNDAAGWLRQASTLDPGNDLLRVHLGRVLALRRDDDNAYCVLNDVLQTTKDEATAYLAAIFIGGLRERQVKLEDAAAAYRAAIARFPLGHAAYIGLSEVLQRTGKGDQSREVLHNLLSESLGPSREPLWWYQFDPPGVAEGRLDALRKEVRQ